MGVDDVHVVWLEAFFSITSVSYGFGINDEKKFIFEWTTPWCSWEKIVNVENCCKTDVFHLYRYEDEIDNRNKAESEFVLLKKVKQTDK